MLPTVWPSGSERRRWTLFWQCGVFSGDFYSFCYAAAVEWRNRDGIGYNNWVVLASYEWRLHGKYWDMSVLSEGVEGALRCKGKGSGLGDFVSEHCSPVCRYELCCTGKSWDVEQMYLHKKPYGLSKSWSHGRPWILFLEEAKQFSSGKGLLKTLISTGALQRTPEQQHRAPWQFWGLSCFLCANVTSRALILHRD